MRSLAPKARKEESEFDDLLGQLVDELAMTPASESAVSFTPEVPVPPAHVSSTQELAVEAAAAARARAAAPQPANNNAVKIAGIIAAAMSTVAIAALFMFSQQNEGSSADENPVVQPSEPAAPEPKVELPATPPPIAPAPVVVAPVPTPEPVVVAPPVVEPAKADKPKPRKRVDKPKPPKPEPKPSTDDDFDNL